MCGVNIEKGLKPEKVEELFALWKKTVIKTHTFLSIEEIEEIASDVKTFIRQVENIYLLTDDASKVLGFVGTEGKVIQMLFVDPDVIGKGYGRLLVEHAIKKEGVSMVDVNEQNPKATGFYEHMGFRVFSRSEFDDSGRPYPILHMMLE